MLIKVNDNGFIYDSSPNPVWLPPVNVKQFEIFNDYHRYLLVHGPRKCVEIGTPIWTPDGQRPVQDMKLGDKVIAFDGISQVESYITGSGVSDTTSGFELRAETGQTIRCSGEHPIWCCTDSGLGVEFIWMRADDIARCIAKGQDVWSPSISDRKSPVIYGESRFIPSCLESYWLGAMTGDGSCQTQYSLGFTNADPECVDLVRRFSELRFACMKSGQRPIDYRFTSAGSLKTLLLESGLSCRSRHKRIPSKIMCGGIGNMADYMMGLFDTDGTVSKDGKQIDFCSASEGLIRDSQIVLGRLGIFSSISSRPHSCTNATTPHRDIYWHLKLYGEDVARFANVVGSAITRKRDRLKRFRPTTFTRSVQNGIPRAICEHIRRLSSGEFVGSGFRKGKHNRKWYRDRRWLESSRHHSPSIRKLQLLIDAFPDDSSLKHFSASSRWVKWSSATPIQSRFWDIGVYKYDSFIASGIPNHNSGKTFGIIHKVIRHAFDTPGAMVAIVCKTIKNAKSAGVWVHLERFLKLWERDCPGFLVVEGPKQTGDSKMSYVRIRSRSGAISEIQCHSLEHSKEVESKFKGPAYSMFWLSEFDQYCDEHAFDIFCDALRMTPMISYEEHQIICDCNPPESGENNWIHDKWFKFVDSASEDPEEDSTFREGLHRILVTLDDNPQLHPKERRELESRYRKRKGLYARFVEGKWTTDVTDGFFSEVYDETLHVVGSCEGHPSEHQVIVPSTTCTSLLCGWDMGDKNHSFHLIEKTLIPVIVEDDKAPGKQRTIQLVQFAVIDELVDICKKGRPPTSIPEFTLRVMKILDSWHTHCKDATGYSVRFRHYSDTSAFEERAGQPSAHAVMVLEASNGFINLERAPKYNGSNRDKVSLLWQLLHARRLWISAQLRFTRSMLASVRQGRKVGQYIMNDDHKHPFDSMSYPILAEAPIDMLRSARSQGDSKSYDIVVSSF